MASNEIWDGRWNPGRNGNSIVEIIIHTTEGSYGPGRAQGLKTFMRGTGNTAGYHYCYDTETEEELVSEWDTAFGAGGVNLWTLHLCVCGKSASIPWADFFNSQGGTWMILRTAALCMKYLIWGIKLTPEQVRDKERGIAGHGDVSVYHPTSDGHTDPYPNFPWEDFVNRVNWIILLSQAPPPLPPNPEPISEGPVQYQVVQGDYLTGIAQKCYHVSDWTQRVAIADAISNANRGVTNDDLKPGMWLTLPGHMVLK